MRIITNQMNMDEQFMQIALGLAMNGRGAVEPNPMVGAVIARDGVELARGWHRRFGGPHAEADALSAAKLAGCDLRGATMYVTLEPCCHTNKKTPPCAPAIIAAGLARVIVAMEDPDANVSGRGIAAMREAGVEVAIGLCEEQARELLEAYVKLRTTGRPWVIAKWAQTTDGFLDLPADEDRWISSQESRAEVHRIRGLCDGILVGVGTVLADDPLLTNRSGAGRQPARVVLDTHLRTPVTCKLVRTEKDSPVVIATTHDAITAQPQDAAMRSPVRTAQILLDSGVELLELPASPCGVDLSAMLDELGRRKWTHLLVEGGQRVLESFTEQQLVDEFIVFVSPRRVQNPPPSLPRFDIAAVKRQLDLTQRETRMFGLDTMYRLTNTLPFRK